MLQIEIARAFQKAWRAFAVNYNSKVFRRSQILEAGGAVEYSLDCANARADSCSESILACFFQTFTTRNTALQNLRINERLIDAFSRRLEFVAAFQFHCTLAFAA